MNIRHAILTATLALAASAAQAKQPPITFARSGKTASVHLAMDKDRPVQSVVLRAYGRVWTKPAKKAILIDKQDRANVIWLIDVPNVRVPAVFRITPVKDAKRTLGELVAYPDRNVEWDKKIILYCAAAPNWFDQWTEATGLPAKKVNIAEFNPVNRRKPNDKKHLLVLGRKTAGKDFWGTLAIAKKHKINVLVLDADWFGGKSGKVAVQPKQMAGGLAELRKQKWSRPLTFGSHRKPWPGIANRWAWIYGKESIPLVEEIDHPVLGKRIVVNYLPWHQQLGRSDVTDMMLLNVLSVAAIEAQEILQHRECILYPSSDVLDKTPKQRPVLTVVRKAWTLTYENAPETIIIDLRGKESPPAEFRQTLKWLENRGDKEAPLLILGDDPLLDDWKWAKIDRKKKVFKQAGVFWLPDDTLPPSAKNQIRLMLKLTELGIPLEHPKPLKGEKKDEKPNK